MDLKYTSLVKAALLASVIILSVALQAQSAEFRGFWVDTFHVGLLRTQEVTRLVAETRSARMNAVLPEVRKRGDAFYQSNYEPKALESFDSLKTLIGNAHNTNSGPRIDVHAWMVVYPIWRVEDGRPGDSNHIFNLHQDWLDQDLRGATNDGREYHLDPGHPEVQKHLFNVAMDIVTNYDIDGLNFDYLRYPGQSWGYNPVSIARFNRLYNRSGTPSSTDTNWMQFRRDQVSALLRKIYLSAIAVKPHIKISAATVFWLPVPKNEQDWLKRSGAYNHILQDWRAWMSEGILDISMPMIYLNHASHANTQVFSNLVDFAASQAYGRHVVISPASYLNSITGTVEQIALACGTQEHPTQGVCLYSYASFSNELNVSRRELIAALTGSDQESKPSRAVFAEPAALPDMPWKTSPTTGHIKGFVSQRNMGEMLDGAKVEAKGPIARSTVTDATGFYGFVGLPPGDYRLTISYPNCSSTNVTAQVALGKVTTADIVVSNGAR